MDIIILIEVALATAPPQKRQLPCRGPRGRRESPAPKARKDPRGTAARKGSKVTQGVPAR